MLSAMYGALFIDRQRAKNLILMLCLNETMDHLAVSNSVHWYGHVLRREDCHVFRMALEFEVEGKVHRESCYILPFIMS